MYLGWEHINKCYILIHKTVKYQRIFGTFMLELWHYNCRSICIVTVRDEGIDGGTPSGHCWVPYQASIELLTRTIVL